MQKGRGYRRINPPNANLNMQPYGCAPVRFKMECLFEWFGNDHGGLGAEHSNTGTYVPGALGYFWDGGFDDIMIRFNYTFIQRVSPSAYELDFQLELIDLFGNHAIYQWLNQDQDSYGWSPIMAPGPNPILPISGDPPFGNLFGLFLTPVRYFEEP